MGIMRMPDNASCSYVHNALCYHRCLFTPFVNTADSWCVPCLLMCRLAFTYLCVPFVNPPLPPW